MEKRLILAIALSMFVLWLWSAGSPKNQPLPPAPEAPAPSLAAPVEKPIDFPAEEVSEGPVLKYTNKGTELDFNQTYAAIKEVGFKDYPLDRFNLYNGFLLKDKTLLFKQRSVSVEGIGFVQSDPNKQIIKQFNFTNSQYSIELEIIFKNLSNLPLTIDTPVVLGTLNFAINPENSRFQDIAVSVNNKVHYPNPQKKFTTPDIQFVSLRDRYFCNIIQPATPGYSLSIEKIGPQKTEIFLHPPKLTVPPGQEIREKFSIYLGPQDLGIINSIQPAWSAVIYYGKFDVIAQLLFQLLKFLYQMVHSWGWAIIIFTVTIYLILYPLSLKQLRSMKEMQALQPRIEEIRKTYKDNPQRLNKEIMDLYREHKVNPFGGCLPLILQIPLFFALYQVLIRSVYLRGVSFLWIKDLTEPDRLFLFPSTWMVKEFNLLPILTTVLMFLQQKVSFSGATGTSAEQQKIMLIAMPLVFGFAFYKMPAGWLLYFFVYTLLTVFFQFRLNRKK